MAGRVLVAALCFSAVVSLTSRSASSFVAAKSTFRTPRLRARTLRPAGNSEYSYEPFSWALDVSIPEGETEQVLELCDMNTVWPGNAGSIDREGFRARLKGRGARSDKAIDTIFNCFAGGTWLATNRELVEDLLQKCRSGGKVDAGPIGVALGARLQIIGAWLFLNVFSTFAGYFVIGRPILASQFGIDLLPSLPRWWE
ncbi:unnamed protein product [Symbiodinium natans]|uniref:Uncharacterized protein n=1 Tax=Symbiodinium natans TaxID=878477 RepID=A0A812LVL1_9DINO|nr:unnamed protein product [Symbiodinium natans]